MSDFEVATDINQLIQTDHVHNGGVKLCRRVFYFGVTGDSSGV